MEPERVATGLAFPEGPAFDEAGYLYLVSMKSGEISRLSPAGEMTVFARTGGTPNGLAFGPGGLLYVAEAGHKSIMTADPRGELTTLCTEADGHPFAGPNDLCFDRRDNFYFTDPVGSNAENPVGCVYYCTPAGDCRKVAEGLAFPNGLALTADGAYLYVVNELAYEMVRYEVAADGSLGPAETFAPIRQGGIGGDGMALDVEGNLYVANYGLGTIDVISEEGEFVRALPAGGKNPTNVAFGGADMRDLYITEVEHGALFRLRNDVPGLRLF